MLYLTFNDAPGGILKSQVLDVVKLLREESGEQVQLVSFVSMRNYRESKAWIKSHDPTAKVLPMTPKLQNWRKQGLQLTFGGVQLKGQPIIARGIFAANLALDWKQKGVGPVIYDGRGAIAAEVSEYGVIPPPVAGQVPALEKRAVLESDFHIAVTDKLRIHWEEAYGYKSGPEVIIPCTLSTSFDLPAADEIVEKQAKVRSSFGWTMDDTVLVYSGSTAGWQSFDMLGRWLRKQLKSSNVKVLFLSREDENIAGLQADFPDQVQRAWLKHEEVLDHLIAGDYGIMVREKSVTNQVASPTKFAEYLMAGLEILTSPHIGDYPDFVREHHCGQLLENEEQHVDLTRLSADRKRDLMLLGRDYFSKSSEKVRNSYRELLKQISALS